MRLSKCENVKKKFGKFMGNKMCKYDRINIRKKQKKIVGRFDKEQQINMKKTCLQEKM